MLMYLTLAWRNLWRNSHRTLITTASIFFAVILVLFTRSMQLGSYDHVIRNTLKIYTGFLQVQGSGFWEKRSLENSMELSDSLLKRAADVQHVTHVSPRIESFALASSGENTRGVMITGIDPQRENRMSSLSTKVVSGQYLQTGSSGIMVARKLAEYLSVKLGDSLVLLSQGYHGVSAAGIYPVTGIVDLPIPDLNTSMIYMSLSGAQYFFSMQGRVTSMAVMIDDPGNMGAVQLQLQSVFKKGYAVMNWREMVPELVQSIEVDNAGGVIMLGILYLVIGFGIFGTVMMMFAERKREFAILLSVGMKRWRMNLMVFLETVMIGLMGAFAGAVVSIPVLLYMRGHPIRLEGNAAEAMLQYGFRAASSLSDTAITVYQAGIYRVHTFSYSNYLSFVVDFAAENNQSFTCLRAERQMIPGLAWKNIWRNKTRSMIIMTAIALGLFGGLLSSAVSIGMGEQMIRSAIFTRLSHIQIHNPEFARDRDIDYVIPNALSLAEKITKLPGVVAVSPRVVVTAMASSAVTATGVQMLGSDSIQEAEVSIIDQSLSEGTFFGTDARNPALIGEDLAKTS